MIRTDIPGEWYHLLGHWTLRGAPDEDDEDMDPPPVTSVLVLSQDDILETVLRRRLSGLTDITVHPPARTAGEAIRALESFLPGVLVREASHPLPDERQLVEYLREREFPVPILNVIHSLDIPTLLQEERDGVRGWIHSRALLELVPYAVRGLAREGYWLDPHVGNELCEALRTVNAQNEQLRRRLARYEGPLGTLTAREWSVLQDIARGLSSQEIATKDGVSVYTIKGHGTGILKKLGVGDRNQAAELLRRYGFG